MPITALFERIGAPLVNPMWSWGAYRQDGSVVLRAWQDETRPHQGGRYIRLANHAHYADEAANLGYNERLRHLASVRAGMTAYVVMLRAEDVDARPRTIAGYNDRDVFKLGQIAIIEGDEWGEIVERVSVTALM